MNKWLKLILSILICQSAGLIGSIFTFEAIPNWYQTLNKPFFSPPNWLFGPVWTILYTLMGISLFLIWQNGLEKKENKNYFLIFLVHLFFNASWSIVFFGLKNPLLALFNIAIIIGMVLFLIFKLFKVNKTASYLLIPYLLWLSFASILNFAIWQLN